MERDLQKHNLQATPMDAKSSKSPASAKRSSPTCSTYDSFPEDSPDRSQSPLHLNQTDPPDTPPYSSPIGFPSLAPADITRAQLGKFEYASPSLSPIPISIPPKSSDGSAMAVLDKQGIETAIPSSSGRRRREEVFRKGEIGFRVSEILLSLTSFSVMAADKTQGWAGDSFDRYREYRYCLSVNVAAFVFSCFQAYDLWCFMATGKHVLRHHLSRYLKFFVDQVLAYLLISASSSAASRVSDWESNWGRDKFTGMATASVALSFLSFLAYAGSSVMSGYNLCNYGRL